MKMDDYSCLTYLLKLTSKQQMRDLCRQAFLYRKRGRTHLPTNLVSETSELLGISAPETRKVISSLSDLLKAAVFQGSSDPNDIFTLFPDGFHKNLRDLITKIILDESNSWKSEAVSGQVCLPKLTDFDWRVDMKTSSDAVARMSVPTCILNLQIEEKSSSISVTPQKEEVNVELSKETLDTMLDGLGKIRDQLASVARK